MSFLGAIQRQYSEQVEESRFFWQTGQAFVMERECRLLAGLQIPRDGLVVEIGCGEGANLFNLHQAGGGRRYVGIDISWPRLRFASQHKQSGASTFVQADAFSLPLIDGSVSYILCRDVWHHLNPAKRQVFLDELWRVLAPSGCCFFLEANYRNPLFRCFAWLVPHEHWLRYSTPDLIRKKLTACGWGVTMKMREPSAAFRLLLHYRYGLAFFRRQWFFNLFAAYERRLRQFGCESHYGYIQVRAIKICANRASGNDQGKS